MSDIDWKQQYEAFLSAPIPCAAFFVIGAILAWWLKGQVTGGTIDALTERLTLAGEKLDVAEDRLKEAQSKVEQLEQQVKQGMVSLSPIAGDLLGQTLSSLTAVRFAQGDLRTSLAPSESFSTFTVAPRKP